MKMQPFILSVILLSPLLLLQGCAPVAVTGATTAVEAGHTTVAAAASATFASTTDAKT